MGGDVNPQGEPQWSETQGWGRQRDMGRQVGEEAERCTGPAWGPWANIRQLGINYILYSLELTLRTAVIRQSPIRPAVNKRDWGRVGGGSGAGMNKEKLKGCSSASISPISGSRRKATQQMEKKMM